MQYADLGVGIANVSISVVAIHLGANQVLTLDERHSSLPAAMCRAREANTQSKQDRPMDGLEEKKGRARSARPYEAKKLAAGYHPSRKPNRKNRSSMPSRPVLLMRFRIMNAPLVTLRELGRSKCGVFVMLKPSALT